MSFLIQFPDRRQLAHWTMARSTPRDLYFGFRAKPYNVARRLPVGRHGEALRPVPTLIMAGGLPVTDTSLGRIDDGEPSPRT